jgi:ribosome-associated protein
MLNKMKKTKVDTLSLARDVANAAAKIKAVDIKILDLRKLTSFTDFFIIASGTSDRHVGAIAESIIMEMKKKNRIPLSVEGTEHAQWIIVDYGDCVAHIFYRMMRDIYAIEKLWADAKEIKIRKRKAHSVKRKISKKK